MNISYWTRSKLGFSLAFTYVSSCCRNNACRYNMYLKNKQPINLREKTTQAADIFIINVVPNISAFPVFPDLSFAPNGNHYDYTVEHFTSIY